MPVAPAAAARSSRSPIFLRSRARKPAILPARLPDLPLVHLTPSTPTVSPDHTVVQMDADADEVEFRTPPQSERLSALPNAPPRPQHPQAVNFPHPFEQLSDNEQPSSSVPRSFPELDEMTDSTDVDEDDDDAVSQTLSSNETSSQTAQSNHEDGADDNPHSNIPVFPPQSTTPIETVDDSDHDVGARPQRSRHKPIRFGYDDYITVLSHQK